MFIYNEHYLEIFDKIGKMLLYSFLKYPNYSQITYIVRGITDDFVLKIKPIFKKAQFHINFSTKTSPNVYFRL